MKKHFFLICANVVFSREHIKGTRGMNTLVTSEQFMVTRAQIGNAQQACIARYYTEVDTERKTGINDVVVQSISYLGHMTNEEFHGELGVPEMPEPASTEEEPAQEQEQGE